MSDGNKAKEILNLLKQCEVEVNDENKLIAIQHILENGGFKISEPSQKSAVEKPAFNCTFFFNCHLVNLIFF